VLCSVLHFLFSFFVALFLIPTAVDSYSASLSPIRSMIGPLSSLSTLGVQAPLYDGHLILKVYIYLHIMFITSNPNPLERGSVLMHLAGNDT
jgi:hypothetical protein